MPKRQSSDAGVPKTNEAKSKPSVDIDVSDFSPYVPDDWRSISHPAPLLEPSGLSLVKGPDLKKEMPDWSPHPALLKGGKYKISNAQLQVAALGRYNMLQNRGMILADKMGVGKTISIIALAGDGYLSGEVPRQIIVANKKEAILNNFIEDAEKVGLGNLPLTSFFDTKGKVQKMFSSSSGALLDNETTQDEWKPFDFGDGIVLIPYNYLSEYKQAISEWLNGTDKYSRIIYDESQNIKNRQPLQMAL